MRLATRLMTFAALLTPAAHVQAVGRMPGNSLQFMGWGYGAGYHAPIAHAHPPVRRAPCNAPGGHGLHGHIFGHSRMYSHFGGSHRPLQRAYYGRAVPPRHPVELLPPEPHEDLPRPDRPEPSLEGPPDLELPPAPDIPGERRNSG